MSFILGVIWSYGGSYMGRMELLGVKEAIGRQGRQAGSDVPFRSLSRYGIISAASPRVASQYAPDGKGKSLERSVLQDSLPGIFRAGRCEAAGRRREGRDELPVEQYREYQQPRKTL